ncbi:hypothetical protein HD554DRAFT_548001 [Boletus coccyginus]|nr:hypothetical protein HD554DRAFT_548001 [Boletus coccyginus]
MANVDDLHPASSLPMQCDTAIAPLSLRGEESITQKSALINLLPNEILEIIFIHCAFYHYQDLDGLNPVSRVPRWVNVSYVSHHWRNVALNCPTLWTHLFVTPPHWNHHWMDVLLARSKQVSLKLRANLYDPEMLLYEPCFEQVMERIQELFLNVFASEGSYDFLHRLSLVPRAPRLQNLEISWVQHSPNREWPSVLFDGDTPALRTLTLRGCPLRWYLFKLSGLTTLDLYYVPAWVQQNTAEFLATLSFMQDLAHLYLDHSLPSATGFISSATFQTFQKIKFPCLSRLFIAAPYSTVVALLSCVNIPLQTRVKLECNSEHDLPLSRTLHHNALLCSLLTQRFTVSDHRAPLGLTIRSLVIQRREGGVALAFSASDRDCNSYPPISQTGWESRDIPLQISAYYGESMTTSNQARIISDICCSIPLTDVQTVHAIHAPFSSAFWRKTLGHLQDLRYLRLSLGNMPDLASVLSVTNLTPHGLTGDRDGYADRGPDRIFAPVLEKLELYDVQLSKPGSRPTPQPAADVQSLYDALSTRKGSRGRLSISKCPIAMWGYDLVFHKVVGRWGGGQFRVVKERSKCHYYDNNGFGSRYYGDMADLCV